MENLESILKQIQIHTTGIVVIVSFIFILILFLSLIFYVSHKDKLDCKNFNNETDKLKSQVDNLDRLVKDCCKCVNRTADFCDDKFLVIFDNLDLLSTNLENLKKTINKKK